MNVLNECRDARNKDRLQQRNRKATIPSTAVRPPSPDPYDVFLNPLTESTSTQSRVDMSDAPEHTLLQALDSAVGVRFRHAIDACYGMRSTGVEIQVGSGKAVQLTQPMRTEIQTHHNRMRELKRKRTLRDASDDSDEVNRFRTRRVHRPPITDTAQLEANAESTRHFPTADVLVSSHDILRQVVFEKNLLTNPEQLRAFEIIANHIIDGGPQLLMYVGGVGGTGKSHVIDAVLRLFSLIGRSSNVLVGAPTGAAAIIIGGHTIHSLTLLPDSPGKDLQQLCDIWRGVDYLILDEISMIGATFFSLLNARLQRARGSDEVSSDVPFGGINILFTGDFGQLRPVLDPCLYSHGLVRNPRLRDSSNLARCSDLMGAYLWRQVTTVVLLKVNQIGRAHV